MPVYRDTMQPGMPRVRPFDGQVAKMTRRNLFLGTLHAAAGQNGRGIK